MAETERSSDIGTTQDGFASLDLLRALRTPSMSAIGQSSDPVVFPSFKQPEFFDRSQYAPQSGGSFTQLHEGPQESKSPETQPVQFDVQMVGDGKATVTSGYVRCVDPDSSAGSPITDWEPTIGGAPLSNDPPPEISVSAGKVLYCEVKTNSKGIVTENPTIVLGEKFGTGTHYQPPQLSPTEGALRYPIAEFVADGGDLIAVQLQQGGPILVQPNLWEGRNVGGFRELYKERQNAGDYYEFRTLEQLLADSSQDGLTPVSVLKPVTSGGEGDTIKVRFISQRPDGSESEGGDGPAQIKVEESGGGDGVIVRGNDVNLDISGFVVDLKTGDGLVKSAGALAFGLTGPVRIIDGCGTQMHVLQFTNGLLTAYEIQAVSP